MCAMFVHHSCAIPCLFNVVMVVSHVICQLSSISPFVLTQWGNTALLRAAYSGSVQLVRMLLEEFNSSLDEVTNVSVSSNVHGET